MISLISCKKDIHQSEIETYFNQKSPTTTNTLTISQIDYNREWLVDFIVDLQVANDSLYFYADMIQNHGVIRWNMAMFFEGNQGRRFITVPLEKNNRLLAVILGERINGIYHFYFYSKDYIFNVIHNTQSNKESYLSIYLPAISITINDKLYFSRPNPTLSRWIELEANLMGNQTNTESRGEKCYLIITHWWQYTNVSSDHTYLGSSFDVECIGEMGGDWMHPGNGPNITDGTNPGSGGNPGNSDPDPNNESEPDGLIDYLTPVQRDCLWKGLEQSAVIALTDLIQSTFYEGCDQVSTQALVDSILEELCEQLTDIDSLDFDGPPDISGAQIQEVILGGLVSGNDVYEDVPDDVIQSNFEGCEYLGCVWNAITANNTYPDGIYDHFFCGNLLSTMSNDKDFSLKFSTTSFSSKPGYNNSGKAITGYDPVNSRRNVVVHFNTDNCHNHNVFTGIDLILHETIHAHIIYLVKSSGYLNEDGTNFNEALESLSYDLIGDYYPQDPEHYLMLTYYLEDFKNSMYNINGKKGNPNDYLGLIINGFGHIPTTLHAAGFTQSTIDSLLSQWNTFISDENNYHPDLFNTINNCYEP